jgi:hypothetical protein
MGFTLAFNKSKFGYFTLNLTDDGSEGYETFKNVGLDGDYVITGEFNGHPVYSNRTN